MSQIHHPEYGVLTIHEQIGRSRRCTDAEGRSYTLSSKVLNKLGGRACTALGPTSASPEEFTLSVKLYLDALAGPERDRVARDVWEVCDRMLAAPKLEAVGQ